jgi:hypothetical protein
MASHIDPVLLQENTLLTSLTQPVSLCLFFVYFIQFFSVSHQSRNLARGHQPLALSPGLLLQTRSTVIILLHHCKTDDTPCWSLL